eukprot:TRINITY_DN46153_c0_g1_i1.p1 TRINITY_DN46153_c0_g1~~TRINITY_DN46153_c0_g1_i1.p1  ORF type:complete len:952 (+),score=37.04 TRINITY_DN46153_c0_g1_i1:31-2886(+)
MTDNSVYTDAYSKQWLEAKEVEELWHCFNEADNNGDGMLSRDELLEAGERLGGYYFSLRKFAALDTNKTGRVALSAILEALFPRVPKYEIHRFFQRTLGSTEVLNLHDEFQTCTRGTGKLTVARLKTLKEEVAGYRFTVPMLQHFDPIEIIFEQFLCGLFPRVPTELAHCYATTELLRSDFMRLKYGFEQADGDNSGLLSYEEFSKGQRHILLGDVRVDKTLFRHFDKDKSGNISFQELLTTLYPMIPVWDLQHYTHLWGKGLVGATPGGSGGGQQDTAITGRIQKVAPDKESETLTDEQYLYLRDLLHKLDTDGSGTITWGEVATHWDLLEEHQMTLDKQEFRKITKGHSGTAKLMEFIQYFYPNIPHRLFLRYFATSIPPDTILHLKRGFEQLAVRGKLSISTLVANKELILGMPFTVATFKCYGEETIQFSDFLKGLYRNISADVLDRYALKEIRKVDYDTLRQEWLAVDQDRKNYIVIQDIINRDKRLHEEHQLTTNERRITRRVFYGASRPKEGNVTFPAVLQFLYPCVPHHDILRYAQIYKDGSEALQMLYAANDEEEAARYLLEEEERVARDQIGTLLWEAEHTEEERRKLLFEKNVQIWLSRMEQAEDVARWLIEKAEDHYRHNLRMKEEGLRVWLHKRLWRMYVEEHSDIIAEQEHNNRNIIQQQQLAVRRQLRLITTETIQRQKIADSYNTQAEWLQERTPTNIHRKKLENVATELRKRDDMAKLEIFDRNLVHDMRRGNHTRLLDRNAWNKARYKTASDMFYSVLNRPKEPILRSQRYYGRNPLLLFGADGAASEISNYNDNNNSPTMAGSAAAAAGFLRDMSPPTSPPQHYTGGTGAVVLAGGFPNSCLPPVQFVPTTSNSLKKRPRSVCSTTTSNGGFSSPSHLDLKRPVSAAGNSPTTKSGMKTPVLAALRPSTAPDNTTSVWQPMGKTAVQRTTLV